MRGYRGTQEERFWRKVEKTPTCWNWTGGKTWGYGYFGQAKGQIVRAHRWSYEHLVGPIPEERVLHHICENRACVNPDHLKPVTNRENIKFTFDKITHCPRGHPYSGKNLYIDPDGARRCVTCRNLCR